FLEGHRQNSANFGDVRQSSLLLRFGQLTPAFVLQVLAPLLLIFVGHSGVVRERESGTLRVLLAQGVSGRQLVIGKLLALTGFAGLIILLALLALGWMAMSVQTLVSFVLCLSAGYIIWLLIWTFAVVLMSSLFARTRDVLLAMLAVWAV
ncbi:ABC transporter permease, partial [Staphylococcus aureus]